MAGPTWISSSAKELGRSRGTGPRGYGPFDAISSYLLVVRYRPGSRVWAIAAEEAASRPGRLWPGPGSETSRDLVSIGHAQVLICLGASKCGSVSVTASLH